MNYTAPLKPRSRLWCPLASSKPELMDTMEPHDHGIAADILTSEVAIARQRIHRTELALQRTEEMLAENLELRSRIRTAVEAAERLGKGRSSQL
ncbi:hypothetical protein NKJ35_15245 [Mesorhizobium sp. M0136]|uniref:hypothetical protein n=1 Tax=Mesorhizobium sp. M0136 TaxID=2956890 RepID=UPI00333B7286